MPICELSIIYKYQQKDSSPRDTGSGIFYQSVDYFLDQPIRCFLYKMAKNVDQSSNVLFCP